MKTVSYWLDSAPSLPPSNEPLPERADVVVIGGGYTGLSTALHLARKGAEVVLLEAETIGWGASGRNGGHCNTGITVDPQTAIDRYGAAKARELYQAALDAVDFVERLVADEGIDCDFRRCGRLGLAYKPAHFESYRARQRLLAEQFGHELELLSRDELGREIGSTMYHGGILDPLSAQLHPGKYVVGLAQAARRAGVELRERTTALAIEREPAGGFRVVTTRGPIRAGQVMVATNGYTDRLHRGLQRRVLPIGSFVVATEPLSAELAQSISPGRRNMVDSKNFSYYFRLTPDNRLIFGGRARFALSNPESDQKSAPILYRGLTQVFPQLEGVKLDYVWGGTVAFTFDRMLHVGEIDGVYYALGYCGHGVQMASYIGQIMAEVMDGRPEVNPWRDIQFLPVPYAIGWKWLLPLAGMYYKALDVVR